MATVTKTFDYSGTLQQATIPPGTTSIDIIIWGGAGGGGGANTPDNVRDSGGSGYTNYGGGGHGGAGQNGVVILRYPDTHTISNPGGGLTLSTSTVGSNKVTTITAGTGNIQFA